MAVPRGSEPRFRRPVVVVQSDAFNLSAIQTVFVAVITSNTRLAAAPGNLTLTPEESGLSRESVVNTSQLITLDKQYLTQLVGSLPSDRLAALDEGLRLVLSLA